MRRARKGAEGGKGGVGGVRVAGRDAPGAGRSKGKGRETEQGSEIMRQGGRVL